jgi:hypothetical protein
VCGADVRSHHDRRAPGWCTQDNEQQAGGRTASAIHWTGPVRTLAEISTMDRSNIACASHAPTRAPISCAAMYGSSSCADSAPRRVRTALTAGPD